MVIPAFLGFSSSRNQALTSCRLTGRAARLVFLLKTKDGVSLQSSGNYLISSTIYICSYSEWDRVKCAAGRSVEFPTRKDFLRNGCTLQGTCHGLVVKIHDLHAVSRESIMVAGRAYDLNSFLNTNSLGTTLATMWRE